MRATNHEGFFSHTQNPLTNQIPSFSFILRYHFLSFSRIPRLHVSFSFFHSRPSAPLCNSVAATIFIRSLTRHHNPHPNNFRALFLWSLAGHLFFGSICLCLLLIQLSSLFLLLFYSSTSFLWIVLTRLLAFEGFGSYSIIIEF